MTSIGKIKLGYLSILVSSVFTGASGVPYYLAYKQEPGMTLWVGSLIRILANCAFVLVPFLMSRDRSLLIGNKERSLFYWGILGAITTTSAFAAVVYLGSGLSQLFQLLSVLIIVLLRPWLLGEKNSSLTWIAVLGSSMGFLLLKNGTSENISKLGLFYATVSGVSCGLAYLMAAKSGRENKPITIMFYWSAFSLLTHGVLLSLAPVQWPQSPRVFLYLLFTGILATLAQYLATVAYRNSPSAPVAAMTYFSPLVAVVMDIMILDIHYPAKALMGGLLILAFGVAMPFLKVEQPVSLKSVSQSS